jgi:hypothetical protein
MTLLEPSETAPLRASARPSSVALSTSVMLVSATMLPCHFDEVPMVADEPTCHQTFAADAPLISTMLPAVVSDVPAWKTNTAFGSPPPSSVSVPVTEMPLAVQ